MPSFPRFGENKKDYNDTGCNISAGWNLTGRDWGCCGSYEGCCKMASKLCYFHDSICQCCRFGWYICGPECKPDIECFSTIKKGEGNFSKQFESSTVNKALDLSTPPSTGTNKPSSQNALNPAILLFTNSWRSNLHISPTEKTKIMNTSYYTSKNVGSQTGPTSNQTCRIHVGNDTEIHRDRNTQHKSSGTKNELEVSTNPTYNFQTFSKATEKVEKDIGLIPVDVSSKHTDITEGSGDVD
ncbi:uncharacterized protein LOC133191516 [Saccostrea echinata]|uniref:uncharacterized protein LOC133191516 n=1 Tax=Saccostrea echinata TaxID=191078 RepID=UPI002A815CB8|nr:uncharacterized protein LOC133191516 [Saccostrea echinata]